MRFTLLALFFFALLMRGVHGQCFDCKQSRLDTDQCNLPLSYKCEKAKVSFAPTTPVPLGKSGSGHQNLYSTCVPYPFNLERLDRFCCFSSKEKGCQVAIFPGLANLEANPLKYCQYCKDTCGCTRTRAAGAASAKSKSYFALLTGAVAVAMFGL